MKILAIGWDVGGWMGKKNAFAFSSFDTKEQIFTFLSDPFHLQVPKNGFFDIQSILLDNGISMEKYDRVVIGIDAPLGFPKQYKELVNGNFSKMEKPEKEIFSPFAYRETERHLYQEFKKKSLSAPFDKIGNNLTLALYHAHFWNQKYGFNIHPQQQKDKDDKIMIEVYPALLKMEPIYQKVFHYLEPYKAAFNDDEWDACICSLIASIHGSNGQFIQGLKTYTPPKDDLIREEGWIYYIL